MIAFTREAIEDAPSGWRVRETDVVDVPDGFEAVFELAQEGKPFELYTQASLKCVT